MTKALTDLASEETLKALHVSRSKSYDEKTVSAANKEALAAKVAAEELDGWRVLRQNRRSVRMAKDKPIDRQLEDDIWSLLFRMGFCELNASRTFTVDIDGRSPPRQLDVFAKDDETVFIVECTHSREAGPKSIKALVDKIAAIREGVIKAVHTHYGREPRLKVKFAIATRNVEWRKADQDRIRAAGIVAITEDDYNYFSKLTGLLRTAARFQFLGRYLAGEKVEGLRTKVPATRGKAGGTTFYSFLISPHDLLRVAYISHRQKTSNDDFDTYQRMVKPNRLSAIGKFIDAGGKFPTNIVINLKTENPLQFDIQQSFEDTATGLLSLPGQYGTAWVIDGQHRLYGYAYSGREKTNDSTVISVLAYENLPLRDEIGMFIDINTQQVKVTRILVNEIISAMDINDDDPAKRLDAMHAQLALRMDQYPSSPIRARVQTVSQEKSSFRCLTLTSLVDGVQESGLLGNIHKTKRSPATLLPGALAAVTGESVPTLQRAVVILSRYLSLFANRLEAHWLLGDSKGGYLCTNNGIRSLLLVLKQLIAHVERQDEVKAALLDPEDLVKRIEQFVSPLVEYFMHADATAIGSFRSKGSSLHSVSQNALQMEAIIHESIPTFGRREVLEYMASRDVEGTKQARGMIDEVNKIIYDDVVAELKEKYGEEKDAWWTQGVPKAIRATCLQNWNEKNCELNPWNYMFLSYYPDIITFGENWDLFKDRYNFYGRGKKADLVRWIGKLNSARTITHHAEKGPLSKEEVDYVRRVHDLVKRFIEGDEILTYGHRYINDDQQHDAAA